MLSRARIDTYVALVQEFSSRSVLMHAAVADRLGIHVTDLKSLRLLGGEPMTAGALGERIGLTAAAATSLIDRLEKSGFVVRTRDGRDRRRVEVHAVPERIHEVNALYQGQYGRMSELLADYDDAEFRAIADFLERTSIVLKEETESLRVQDKAEAI